MLHRPITSLELIASNTITLWSFKELSESGAIQDDTSTPLHLHTPLLPKNVVCFENVILLIILSVFMEMSTHIIKFPIHFTLFYRYKIFCQLIYKNQSFTLFPQGLFLALEVFEFVKPHFRQNTTHTLFQNNFHICQPLTIVALSSHNYYIK
jgi:hypothetical protein